MLRAQRVYRQAVLLGFLLRRANFPLPPLLIGLILGAPFEQSLRQALLTSGGGYGIFVGSPITIGLVALTVLSLAFSLFFNLRKPRI